MLMKVEWFIWDHTGNDLSQNTKPNPCDSHHQLLGILRMYSMRFKVIFLKTPWTV